MKKIISELVGNDQCEVEGTISDMHPQRFSNGNMLITFMLNDEAGKIPCQYFLHKTENQDLHFQSGEDVIIQGKVHWIAIEKLMLKVTSIKVEQPVQ